MAMYVVDVGNSKRLKRSKKKVKLFSLALFSTRAYSDLSAKVGY